jgi:hypothetical protein
VASLGRGRLILAEVRQLWLPARIQSAVALG